MLQKTLYWTPRVLSIAFIAFLSMFALDVFLEDYKWYEMILGFFMHMIPSLILIVFLVLSWKRYLIGPIMFLIGGVFYVFMSMSWNGIEWMAILLISGPAFLVGTLFILDKYLNKDYPPKSKS